MTTIAERLGPVPPPYPIEGAAAAEIAVLVGQATQRAIANGLLFAWVVYDRPTEYPDKFLARLNAAAASGDPDLRPTTAAIVGDTLESVRNVLEAAGLNPRSRKPDDPPHIVEIWL